MSHLSSIIKFLNTNTEKSIDRYFKNFEFVNNKQIPILPKDFVEFNKIIGLPPELERGIESKILPYQIQISNAIEKHHRVIINKSRKIGATETVLRYIAKNCFDKYSGFNVMIVAGNRQSQAEEILNRLDKFFEKGLTDTKGVRFSYHDIIKKKTKKEIVFFNGTRILAFPAAKESLRGLDRVACVFLDEAAHFKILDDGVIYDALKPNLANTNGDFIMVSTPNGRRGIFYDLWEQGKFQKLELPYTLAIGLLLSEEFIEGEKNDVRIDFAQEYECKFTSSLNAAFDEVIVNRNYIPKVVTDWSEIIGRNGAK